MLDRFTDGTMFKKLLKFSIIAMESHKLLTALCIVNIVKHGNHLNFQIPQWDI